MKNKVLLIKCTTALIGIFLIGLGVAFNAMAQLGNDPVGIFYDGVRNTLGLTAEQLGTASYIVNGALAVLLLFIGRSFLNLGTLIYIVPYGTFVKIGGIIYQQLFPHPDLLGRIIAVVIGCLGIFVGVAIFIAMSVGVDPMTGVTLVIGKKLNWEYRKAKILFDISLVIIGVLLGGKLGIVTIVVASLGGPVVQFIAEQIEKFYQKKIFCKFEEENEEIAS